MKIMKAESTIAPQQSVAGHGGAGETGNPRDLDKAMLGGNADDKLDCKVPYLVIKAYFHSI